MADKRKKELIRKVNAHVQKEFGGDWTEAFAHYAHKRTDDGTVDADELRDLLAAADVGSSFTRGFYVDGVIREVDRDMDGKISGEEFREVMGHGK